MAEMHSLRVAGALFAVVGLLVLWEYRFRRQRLRNLDWLAGGTFCVVLLLVAVKPDILNAVLAYFSFFKGGGGRIIGLLVFSNLLLFMLMYTALSRCGRLEHQLHGLVRELAKREFRREQGSCDAPVCIVIPAYNEADNIGVVLQDIPELVCGLKTRTLVVVDGATDDTEQVVKRLHHLAVSYVINQGGGSALQAGYQLALEDGATVVVTMDADGQHRPEEIPRLVAPILDGAADLVNGSRVLGEYRRDSQLRALGVQLFNLLISLLMMRRITDASNGFRALRASEYPKLKLMQRQFHSSELLIEALKRGLRVVEVPITCELRLSGASKKGPSLQYAWGFTKAIFATWLR